MGIGQTEQTEKRVLARLKSGYQRDRTGLKSDIAQSEHTKMGVSPRPSRRKNGY